MGAIKRLVHLINLQRMGFMEALAIQQQLAREHLDQMKGISNTKPRDVVLLVEHNPVFTTGIREKYTEVDEKRLKSTGAEFYRADRGGLITFHGPGQLVAYPIINLKNFNIGMRKYVAALEQTMIRTCNRFGLDATTTEHTGVWIADRKIGAIGIHGRRFVTTHGISLNCNTDLDWFKHIVACGIVGKEVTSLSRELGENISITQTVPCFLEAFEKEFNCNIVKDELQIEDVR